MKLAIYKHENSPQMVVLFTEEEWINKLGGRFQNGLDARVSIEWDPVSRTIYLRVHPTGTYAVRSYETRRGLMFETRVAIGKLGFPISQGVASFDVTHASVFGSNWVRIILEQTLLGPMLLPAPAPDKPKVLSILGVDDLKTALEIINDAAATIPGVQLRVDADGRVRARVEVEL